MTPIESYPTSPFVSTNYETCGKKWVAIELGFDSPVTNQPLTEKRIDFVNCIVSAAHPKKYGRKAYLAFYCQLTKYKVEDLISGKYFEQITNLDLIKLMTLPGFDLVTFRKALIAFNRNPNSEPFKSLLAYFQNQQEPHTYVYLEPDLRVRFPFLFKYE